jgi:hypothetical protein
MRAPLLLANMTKRNRPITRVLTGKEAWADRGYPDSSSPLYVQGSNDLELMSGTRFTVRAGAPAYNTIR